MKRPFQPTILLRADGSFDTDAYTQIARKARAKAAKSLFSTVFQSVR